jgi:hypothetical protein
MDQKILVESMAMDLKRVALGVNRGSFAMANRFKEEALNRSVELEKQPISEYLKKLLTMTKKSLSQNTDRVGEDALMFSTLLQNFALKNLFNT